MNVVLLKVKVACVHWQHALCYLFHSSIVTLQCSWHPSSVCPSTEGREREERGRGKEGEREERGRVRGWEEKVR